MWQQWITGYILVNDLILIIFSFLSLFFVVAGAVAGQKTQNSVLGQNGTGTKINPLHQCHKDLAIGRHMQSHRSLNDLLYFVVILQLTGGNTHRGKLIISTVMMLIVLPLRMRLLFTVLDSIIFLDLFVGHCNCVHPAEIKAMTSQ